MNSIGLLYVYFVGARYMQSVVLNYEDVNHENVMRRARALFCELFVLWPPFPIR